MAENRTQPIAKSVPEFLEQIEDPIRSADCKTIAAMMEKLSGSKPKMWGDSIHLEKLGKFKNGKGCLYIKQPEDVNMNVLESLITTSIKHLKET
jgi:hypothetical protein